MSVNQTSVPLMPQVPPFFFIIAILTTQVVKCQALASFIHRP